MFGRDRKVTLLRSSEWKRRFITGVETPACILTSRRDSSFVLFYKTFWADGWVVDGRVGEVTLLRSSIRNNTFYTGTPPFGLHPCLYCIVPTGLILELPFYAGTPLRCILLRKESGGASAEIMHA